MGHDDAFQRRFRAMIEHSSDAITLLDADGVVQYTSPANRRILGYEDEEFVGLTVFDLMHPEDLPATLELFASIAGAPGAMASARFRFRHKDGSYRWIDGNGVNLLQEPEVQAIVAHYRDVTLQREAEGRLEELLAGERGARREADRASRRLAFLLAANTLLASSLTLDESLQRLAELSVSEMCDVCMVDLALEDGTIRRAAAVHADPSQQHLVDLIRERYGPRTGSRNPASRAIATGASMLVTRIDEEFMRSVTVDDEHFRISSSLGYRSGVIVPLLGRQGVLGAMTMLATDRSGRRYGDADLALAEDLARRVGLVLDNVRLYERERHTVEVLQHSLLPPALPEIPDVEVAARFHPAGAGTEVGGDFYDVFPIGWGSWGVIVGDVCGKGTEAAAASAQVRHGLRALAAPELAPSAALARLNDVVIRSGSDRFSTVVYGRLDPGPDGARMLLARGGHPFPLVLRRNGTVEAIEGAGTVIGIFPGARYEDRHVTLAPGEAVVIYTDGVTEQVRGEGIGWLKFLVASCRGLDADGIASRIEEAALSTSTREDDVAILVLRARPAAERAEAP